MEDPNEFFASASMLKSQIGPILTRVMRSEDSIDGFILVYYVLSKMKLDIAEGMRALSNDATQFEKELSIIDEMMKHDPDLQRLRNQMNEKLGK